jgi:hypothetical protein
VERKDHIAKRDFGRYFNSAIEAFSVLQACNFRPDLLLSPFPSAAITSVFGAIHRVGIKDTFLA